MSAWEQKRELFLRLGTETYQKPTQLPVCEPVLDFAKNKLTNAENYVEPIRSDNTFVYSDTELYVLGLPFPKKGFINSYGTKKSSKMLITAEMSTIAQKLLKRLP